MRLLLKKIPGSHSFMNWIKTRLPDERDFLLHLFSKGSCGAEIGVYKGDFSARILRQIKPKTLHLIDAWRFEEADTYSEAGYGGRAQSGQNTMDQMYTNVARRFQRPIALGQVILHRDSSDRAAQSIPDASLDWVYIDANHLYNFVRQDLETYYPKIRPGGWITGDDYQMPGWWQGGVEKAVDEFILNYPVQLIEIRHHQFVLRKDENV